MWNYDEQWAIDRMGASFNALYRKYGRVIGDDPGWGAWPGRTFADIYQFGMVPDQSLAKHLAECEFILAGSQPPPPPGDLPVPPPTRDQTLSINVLFQGATATTQEFGTFPMFGPETTTLNDADLDAYTRQMVAQGGTHAEIALSWQYAEPGFLMPVPGRDLSQNLPELARRIARMVSMLPNKTVVLFLAGDGLSQPRDGQNRWLGGNAYNDPVGHTYGYEWLMQNFPRIASYLQNSPYGDLTKYIVFCPGYDGVFYGWGYPGETPDQQPDRVVNFGTLFRQVLPNGYLVIEHSTGHIPVGEGGSDWVPGGRMMNYDGVLSEFDVWVPGQPAGDNVWQIVGRLNRPYHRPANQPANDDPNPPFYLAHDTPRGPVYYVAYEYATYQWTRNRISGADVARLRQEFRDMGVQWVC